MSAAGHHRNRRYAPGAWTRVGGPARPVRVGSWWRRWRRERACRTTVGHCWHPEALIDWWCCECGAETEGMPPQRCVYCTPADAARAV